MGKQLSTYETSPAVEGRSKDAVVTIEKMHDYVLCTGHSDTDFPTVSQVDLLEELVEKIQKWDTDLKHQMPHKDVLPMMPRREVISSGSSLLDSCLARLLLRCAISGDSSKRR